MYKMKTKTYFIAVALFAACALAPAATFAGMITAKVDSWSTHSTQISKSGGWQGGGALFDMTLISGTGIPGIDGTKFLAMCIEPWQHVGKDTYQWDVVDLMAGPTTGSRTPMGQAGADSIFDALAFLGKGGFGEFTPAERDAFQAVVWLASNPGSRIRGLSAAEHDLLQEMLAYNASAEELARISAAALLNRGTNGQGNGQDLIVYGIRSAPSGPSGSVPLPATLPLLLGGILGMAGARRLWRA